MKATDVEKSESGVIETTITDHYSTFIKLPFVANVSYVKKKSSLFSQTMIRNLGFYQNSRRYSMENGEQILVTNVKEATEDIFEKITSASANYTKAYTTNSG